MKPRELRQWRTALLFVAGLLQSPLLYAAAPLQKVVFVFAGFNERTSFIFVAKDMHFFEEQGLDAQIVQMRNAPVSVSAMAANEAQFYTTSATASAFGLWPAASISCLLPALSTSSTAISWFRRRFPLQRI